MKPLTVLHFQPGVADLAAGFLRRQALPDLAEGHHPGLCLRGLLPTRQGADVRRARKRFMV